MMTCSGLEHLQEVVCAITDWSPSCNLAMQMEAIRMARILCTQKLLTALDMAERPIGSPRQRRLPHLRLGNWAATRRRFDGRDLVIAMEQRTCLTLAFPLWPRAGFRPRFADALAEALVDLGVPKGLAIPERGAIDAAPLGLLADSSLAASLDDVAYMCGIELLYHDDLRRVQRNLNDFPHARCNPHVPVDGIARLFAVARTPLRASVH